MSDLKTVVKAPGSFAQFGEDAGIIMWRQHRQLSAYQKAVNQIDDYFEYAMESKRDQSRVHQILGDLTEKLKAL